MTPPERPALRRGLGLLLGLTVAGMLYAGWRWPPLAIAAIWPALFLVPGWAVLAWARPRLGATARLGLAIVVSVALSAHAVYWLSLLVGGYGRETIFAVAALLLLPVPLAGWRLGFSGARRRAAGGWRALRRNRWPMAFATLVAAFVGAVLYSSLWKQTADGIAAGGSNWSDLGVHLSIAQSLNAGNFPPEVPYFAGVPLVYHWFGDFHAAIAAQAAGMFAIPAFVASSAVLAGALALLVHGLGRRLLRGPGARRAALLAAVLVIFGGGLGWIRLVGDVAMGHGDPIGLVLEHSYDNSWFDVHGQSSWPYYRIPSVMGTGLLVHRATTYGLPLLVGAVLLLLAGLPGRSQRALGWRDRPVLVALAGLTGALLAPFHFFFYPAFLLIALLWVLLGRRLVDLHAPRNAALLLVPQALALPFALAAVGNATGSGALQPVAGWESAPFQDGPAAVIFFYLTNLGLPLVLAAAALLVRDTPRRLFLAAWAACLFAIPNLLQVSVIAFDMNKYFQAMWVPVALLAAWLIRRWPWPALAMVLLVSLPSPLLVSAWTAFNREQLLTRDEAQVAEWIAANTPEGSVFATDGWLNSPTDPAGRLRLLTFTPYVANLGFDPAQRADRVHRIYCGGDPALSVRLMRELGASFLLDHRRPGGCIVPTDFTAAAGLELAYDSGSVRVWRLDDDR